ncbi:NUDIX hydrolase [Echinicola marina]|uniref:NUDIX domain-containing protein n=1 Tax=Echinicola marina TaxID=2859768 RepID=UPI001CF6EF7C|nr:NUDIX hydrolase [Echinicola marina]UCS95492.1 NUDIX hydrolase [Echinicola marina]
MEENPWKTKSKKTIYSNPWIELEEHEVVTPGGSDGLYGKVKFKNKCMAIVPVDKDLNTWLVGQYRYTIDEYSWEIPEGGGLIGEGLLESAKRELREETGLRAEKWTEVMRFHTSNSVTDEEGFAFMAEELSLGETAHEDTEDIIVRKLPLKEALEMVVQGKITDVISAAVLLKVARILGV